MTIKLSEERHDSDCCYLAGKMQRTGSCHSGAVAWFFVSWSGAKPNRRALLHRPERDKYGCGRSVKQIFRYIRGKRWAHFVQHQPMILSPTYEMLTANFCTKEDLYAYESFR